MGFEESQNIKNNIDFSFENNTSLFDKNGYLKNNYFDSSNFRKISKSLITNVIKARINEIFTIIKKQITLSGLNLNSGISILLTGGGSKLINLDKYCLNFFGTNVKKTEENIKNENNIENDFQSCFGALQIIKDGWETEAIPQTVSKKREKEGFFAKIFGIRA